ncbi:MAG: UDP-N-acetylmuramoyl-L-alanyl-D-glutamate--2,6-diaminopimelate ligase [Candidatus Zixiibacteriota bacterium]
MLLKNLIDNIDVSKTSGNLNLNIQKIEYDSRCVGENDLFVAITGLEKDGHDFIQDAVDKGAVAAVVQKEGSYPLPTEIVVPDSRLALANVANKYYDFPSRKLKLVGITGTNGKTTTSYMIKSILEVSHQKTGLIGTINHYIGNQKIAASHTTPESLDLQRLFTDMLKEGVSSVVMEVSSHALSLERVWGTDFDVALFTNLGREHLDFHQDMESYRNAKGKLFKMLEEDGKWAVLNRDDPYWEYFFKQAKVPKLSYSIEKNKADVFPQSFSISFNGTKMMLSTPAGEVKINIKFSGKANLYNALASTTCGLALGIDLDVIKKGLESVPPVPGRMERIDWGQKTNVLIDYAHTPDAFLKLLNTLRELTPGKIWMVFGCGGDRDKGKRPEMGRIATDLADHVIITRDNPRTEDLDEINQQIIEGVVKKERVEIILDRKEAIRKALENAKEKDTVILAGKGHESYQIVGKRKLHFSEKEIVENFLKEKGFAPAKSEISV